MPLGVGKVGPQLSGGSGHGPGPMPPHDTAYSPGSQWSSQAPVAPGQDVSLVMQLTNESPDPGQESR